MSNTLRVHEVIEKLQELLNHTTMPTALTDVREITRDGQTGRIQFGGTVDGMDIEQWAAHAATLSDEVDDHRSTIRDLREQLREAEQKIANAGVTS